MRSPGEIAAEAAVTVVLDQAPPLSSNIDWKPLPGRQTDGYNSDADILFYGGAAGGGKLLALDTPIPVPDGWQEMGDLREGDIVFDERGMAVRVLRAFPAEVPEVCYRLTLDDGSEIDAGAEHRWLTFDAAELAALTRREPSWRTRRRERRASQVTGKRSAVFTARLIARNRNHPPIGKSAPTGQLRTTEEIAATLRSRRGRTNHAIPVAAALQLPAANLPLDPYCLGAWLGDGCSRGARFTGIDAPIWEEFNAAGFEVTHSSRSAQEHYIRGLLLPLRELGLLRNKHIPAEYLRASPSQRLALLQGLMDTDGTVTHSGSVEFTNTNERLAHAVHELIVGLGWKARIREGRAKLYGRDCGPVYDIKWTPTNYVFRLPRKRDKQRLATRRTTRFRYIMDCCRIESVPMRCIMTDSPSGLYLAGDTMIPTHNTDLLLGLALTAHQKSIIFRRQFPQLREIIERSKAIIEEAGRFNENAHVWRDLPNGRMLELGACNTEDDKNKWKGRAHDLKGFDEVTEFTESQFRFLMGWTRTATPGQRTRVVCTGNPPTSPIGEWVVRFWAPWLDEQHPHPALPGELRWFAMVDGKDVERENGEPFAHKGETIQPLSRSFISARLADNPYLMATGYESTLQNLPEPLRSMLLFGRFGVGVEDDPWQVIPTQWVILAEQRWTEEAPEALSALGCDVARGGDDKTVLALRHGNWYAPLKKHAGSSTPDGAAVADLVMQHLGEATAFVDVIGVGSSVYDTLHTRGVNVTGVNFAEHSSATDRAHKLKFRNKRAEYYWRMREMLDPTNGENIALPPDRELRADLCSPHWSITTGGIQIESKEDIKGRLGRSTDCGDAVVMALSGVSISMTSAKPAPAESRWRPVAQEGSRWATGSEGKSRWRG